MASRAETNARGAETRARILSAAVQCLTAGGIDDVRIARVARIAGVSTALVHYHFDTRETLLAEALEASFQVAGEVRLSTKYGAGSAAERLRRKVAESLPFAGRRSDEWGLWVELWLRAVREPALRATAAEVYRQLHRSMRDLIAEGVAAGEFAVGDPDAVADRTLALIDGFGLRALLDDPAVPVQRAADEVWSALAAELGLPPDAGAPAVPDAAGSAANAAGRQS
jgi:AcrR family transcriptional regulator